MVNGELCKCADQQSSPCVEEACKALNNGSTSNPLLLLPEPEAKQQQRKSGKVPKSNSGCSKRSRAQLEVSINETEADIKGKAKEGGLSPSSAAGNRSFEWLKSRILPLISIGKVFN